MSPTTRTVLLASGIAASLAVTAPAAATIVSFDFRGVSPATPSKTFVDVDTGVSLTFTALYREPSGFLPAEVTQRAGGLGVLSAGEAGGEGELDSFGANEVLVWTVSAPDALRLDEVLFGNWEDGNDYQLYTDFGAITELESAGLVPGPPSAFNPPNPWSPADDGIRAIANDRFAMKVVAAGGEEAFRIAAMTFTLVPEPASVLLLGSGLLLGAGLWRRRAESSAARERHARCGDADLTVTAVNSRPARRGLLLAQLDAAPAGRRRP